MIAAKVFEVRDAATFIPVVAVLCKAGFNGSPTADYLMRRAGYGEPCVLLTHLAGGHRATYDPYDWPNRTMQVAHDYIEKNFGGLENGAVIDVQFILGETQVKKQSEADGDSPRVWETRP